MPMLSPASNPSSPFASLRGDHVGLRVPDLEAALAWYRDALDFRHAGGTVNNGMAYAFLAPPDDDAFRIELVAGPGAVDRAPWADLHDSQGLHGWHHLCLGVASVDEALAELGRRGVAVVAGPFDVADIGRRIAFFADPWGNLFELTQPMAA